MRELTLCELDAELAEQLPARELMQYVNIAAIGNFSAIRQTNVVARSWVGGSVTQSNTATVTQSFTNSGTISVSQTS